MTDNQWHWGIVAIVFLGILLVALGLYAWWDLRRDRAKKAIEVVSNTELENKELGLRRGYSSVVPVVDRSTGTTQDWPPLRPLRRENLEVQENVREAERPQTSPLKLAMQREGKRMSYVSQPNDEEAGRNVDGGSEENRGQSIGPAVEWTAERRVSGGLTRSSLSSQHSARIPPTDRLSGFSSILNQIQISNPGSPSVRSHRRSSSTTNVASQPEPGPSTRPTSRATHRRYASVDTSTSVQASQTLLMYKYADSLYTVSTLPSYPGTARSLPPPPYLDLAQIFSERTTTGTHAIPAYGRNPMNSMPDVEQVEERGSGV